MKKIKVTYSQAQAIRDTKNKRKKKGNEKMSYDCFMGILVVIGIILVEAIFFLNFFMRLPS